MLDIHVICPREANSPRSLELLELIPQAVLALPEERAHLPVLGSQDGHLLGSAEVASVRVWDEVVRTFGGLNCPIHDRTYLTDLE